MDATEETTRFRQAARQNRLSAQTLIAVVGGIGTVLCAGATIVYQIGGIRESISGDFKAVAALIENQHRATVALVDTEHKLREVQVEGLHKDIGGVSSDVKELRVLMLTPRDRRPVVE